MTASLEESRAIFARRFYEWSLRDWEREVFEDLRLLGSIQGMTAQAMVRFLRSLRVDERQTMTRALITRGHRATLATMGQAASPEQQRLLNIRDAIPLVPSLALVQGGVDRRRLRKLLRERLTAILGDRDDWGQGESAWRHARRCGPFRVLTYVDTGGSTHQLCYDHAIMGTGEHAYLLRRTSLLSWLGISAQTNWDALRVGDEAVAVDALSTICAHFMSAIEGLVEGLSTDV